MPTYIYQCEDCSKKPGGFMVDFDREQPGWSDKGEYLFFVEASMKKIPKHPKCTCGSKNTFKSVNNSNQYFHVRGNCYLDKKGVQRDQNMYKLQFEDPYAHMRTAEDRDYKMTQFRRSGLNMDKINDKHNKAVKESLKTVSEMVKRDIAALSDDEKVVLKFMYDHDDRRDGVSFDRLSALVIDINKILTDLINKFMVFKKENNFILLAEGRSLADSIFG